MAEEIRDDLQSTLINVKTEKYQTHPEYDFALASELTVKITLHEYRDLIEAKGEYERKYKQKEDLAYERYREIEKLKEENTRLKEKVLKLINGETVEDGPVEDKEA